MEKTRHRTTALLLAAGSLLAVGGLHGAVTSGDLVDSPDPADFQFLRSELGREFRPQPAGNPDEINFDSFRARSTVPIDRTVDFFLDRIDASHRASFRRFVESRLNGRSRTLQTYLRSYFQERSHEHSLGINFYDGSGRHSLGTRQSPFSPPSLNLGSWNDPASANGYGGDISFRANWSKSEVDLLSPPTSVESRPITNGVDTIPDQISASNFGFEVGAIPEPGTLSLLLLSLLGLMRRKR